MKIGILVGLLVALSPSAYADPIADLMPMPSSVVAGSGVLPLGSRLCIGTTSSEPRVHAAIERFAKRLPPSVKVATSECAPNFTIQVSSDGLATQDVSEDESYTLGIKASGITLQAPNPLGVIRGFETLLQLLDGSGFRVATIQDNPRFRWRGILIDPCRHWLSIETLERTLDSMSAVKLNVMHLHLSDDQAFRMESKKYPKLQGEGSRGQYYTQAQMKNLIAYARDRGIRIVPEFDVPGHSTSWFVGYPELAAGAAPFHLPDDIIGSPNSAFDPTTEEVYTFLTEFFGEMTAIFPDVYFHIGGDEVSGKEWDKNAAIQSFMAAHSIHDDVALQAYFNTRLFKIVSGLGKKMLGWNEIASPDLPSSGIAVEAWNDPGALRSAVQRGFSGLSSYGLYLDNMITAAEHLRADPLVMSGDLSAEEQARILGGEACMWGELITEKNVDDRIWPRMIAIAEMFWSPHENRPLDDVYRRMYLESARLQTWGNRDQSSYVDLLTGLVGAKAEPGFQFVADYLTPVKFYERFTKVVSVSDPLNKLADSVLAETPASYALTALIERFLKGDVTTAPTIRAQLTAIVNAHASAIAALNSVGLTGDEATMVDKLSDSADRSLEVLDALTGGAAYDPMLKSRALYDLSRYAVPSGDVLVAIMPALTELANALPDGQPDLVRSFSLR